MPHSAKIAFFGTDQFSAFTLSTLIENGYDVSLVVTKPDSPIGRKRVLTPPLVKTIAQNHQIKVLQPTKISEIESDLKNLHIDVGIVVAYGKILPKSILDAIPKGFINVHASILPKYRGSSPIEAALINGDAVTGVSIMKLDAGMDTGPVYAEAQYGILPEDNQLSLYEKLARIGADILIRDLDSILNGTLEARPQDSSLASTVEMIRKSDGEIDWTKSATRINNQIRAYVDWPGSKTTIACKEVTITSATVIADVIVNKIKGPIPNRAVKAFGTAFKTETGHLGIACGQDTIIINTLKPAGKRQMTGKEFLAGHPIVSS